MHTALTGGSHVWATSATTVTTTECACDEDASVVGASDHENNNIQDDAHFVVSRNVSTEKEQRGHEDGLDAEMLLT